MKKSQKENNSPCSFRRVLLCAIVLFATWMASGAQPATPLLKVYSPKAYYSDDYVSSPQNLAIVQSKEGMMYFANPSGVLEFDGYFWRMVEGTQRLEPRCFAINAMGVIFVAGTNDFGYLAADFSGQTVFRSLLHLLNEPDRKFGRINFAYSIGNEVYFLSKKQLIRYKNNEIKVWRPAKAKFLKGYIVNDTLYIRQENAGLMKVAGNDLELVLPAGEEQSEASVLNYFKARCPCSNSTDHLIAKDEDGSFVLFTGRENSVRVSPLVSEFLNAQRGMVTTKTPDGKTVVGTLSGGAIVIDQNGDYVQLINKQNGLPDNIINALFTDATDGLWLGHDVGISRWQLNSPLSFIDPSSGFTGIIVSIVRFEGRLYISTTDGVYVEKRAASPEFYSIQFQRIEDITNQAFTLLEINNTLLVATITGIYEIKDTHAKKIAEGHVLDLCSSLRNEQEVFAGTNDGIVPLHYTNGVWKALPHLAGLNDVIYKIISDKHGVLWASNNSDKIYKVDLSAAAGIHPDISELDISHGVPADWIEPFTIEGEAYFGSSSGIYQYDGIQKKFICSSDALFHYFNSKEKEAGPVRTDRHGNLWVASQGKVGKVFKDSSGAYQWDSLSSMGIPETSIWSIYFDEDNTVWLGTTDFLIKYDTALRRRNIENFSVYVRKVIAGEDSILHLGGNSSALLIPELKYKDNTVAFEFSAPFFEGENRYSAKLEGIDKDWSPWSKETKVRYTNLNSGNYTFRVKAKNIYGIESETAQYAFCILPPFYLTVWAFIVYVVLAGLAVWAIVMFNAKRLIRTKNHLEKIVKERTEELSLRNEELRKAKEFEEQFLANMSHEIRTPMNSVVGLTNLLLKTEKNPQHRQYLNIIKQSADNLLVIINDILDISKIESGKLEIEHVDFSIREVIESVSNMLQLSIKEKGLTLRTEIAPEIPEYVVGDPTRLNEIILNLLNNAVKFTGKGGITIICKVIEENDSGLMLEFNVKDTGMGIAPERMNTLFTYFGQGGKEIARKFGGSGLGLFICRRFIELQGGKIWVESAQGKGTTFFFNILYGRSGKAPETTKSAPAGVPLENLRILLVENTPFDQMVAKDTLEALIKNVKIDIATNGEEAFSRIAGNDYDVVLMDLMMPVLDGCAATRKVRSELPFPKNAVKIMAMSAASTQEEKEECMKAGMNDYLMKPFRHEDLLSKIASLAGHSMMK